MAEGDGVVSTGGIELWLTDAQGTPTKIVGLKRSGRPGRTVGDAQTTGQGSGGQHTYKPQMIDNGTLSAVIGYEPDSATDRLLQEHLWSRRTRAFKIVEVAEDGRRIESTGNLFLTGHAPDDGTLNNERTATVTARLTGRLRIASAAIAITATSVNEEAQAGSTVGVLSVDGGEGSYTFSIPSGGDPDGKFAISGSNLNLADTLDFESATSHQVTIEADNGVDTPVARVVTITVTNAFEQPDLGALTLSGPFEQGATVEIVGAAAGSVISGLTLPTGWTLDSAAREITIAAGAPTGAQSWALLETLADSSNSPRTTNGSSTVTAANDARPMIAVMVAGQSNAQGTAAAGAQDQNVPGVFQYVSNPDESNANTISGNIVPLHHPRPSGTSPANIGLGDYWARRIFASGIVPSGYDLLIVPYARGSTGMITGGEEWKPTAPLGELAQGAINQCTAAMTAAQAIHTDSRFVGFLWAQGENETNNNGGRDAYMTAFIQLRDLIRAQVPTAANCWALIGSMVPEWLKSLNKVPQIQDAHMRLAFENDGVYYDQAPVGLGDAPGNIIHYDADGYRSYGAQLGDALPDLIADPRVIYDFRGDEIGDGATANTDELLGTYQHGGTRLTLQSGTGVGLGAKCISAAATPTGIGGAGIQFLPGVDAGDASLEWTANLSGRQSVTLRANGSYGFFGFDGYLFRVDADNTVSLFDITDAGLTTITPDTPSKPMGVTGTTARFRASAIGTRLRFEVSNDDGANWATVLDTTNTAHASGRIVYMQGGNGTTGSQVFAEDFAIRDNVPA